MPGFSTFWLDVLTRVCVFKLFSIDLLIAFLIWHEKILFHLVMPFSIQSVIMAVALVPDQAIFDNISLVRIGSRFLDNRQECIRWWRQSGLLATQMICNHHCREQPLDRTVDGVTWRCPVKVCKKRITIRHGSFFKKSHLQLWQILCLTYLWCRSTGKSRGMSVADAQHDWN